MFKVGNTSYWNTSLQSILTSPYFYKWILFLNMVVPIFHLEICFLDFVILFVVSFFVFWSVFQEIRIVEWFVAGNVLKSRIRRKWLSSFRLAYNVSTFSPFIDLLLCKKNESRQHLWIDLTNCPLQNHTKENTLQRGNFLQLDN